MPENTDPTQPETQAFPEDLTALSADELTALREGIDAELAELAAIDRSETPVTPEQVERVEQLADARAAIEADEQRRADEVAERDNRFSEALARVTPPAEDGEGGEGEGAPAPEAAEEPAPEAEPAEQPEAVAASAQRRRQLAVRKAPRQPANPTPAGPAAVAPVTMTASANIGSEVAQGQPLATLEDVAKAFGARVNSMMGRRGRLSGDEPLPVAKFSRNFGERTIDSQTMSGERMTAILQEAANEANLPGGSLVAAGGWCAPSENRYGLQETETLDGIIDVPEVGVERGGLNVTPGPSFADIFTDAGFVQTEAQAIAGETKPCVTLDCPEFTEYRLDATGICVKVPLLTNTAYPELTRRWINGTMVAQQHKVAGRVISAISTLIGSPIVPTLTGSPITWTTLTAIERLIEGQRQVHRLAENQTLEVILPRWVRFAIRGDLANRVDSRPEDVTNAQIDAMFRERGANVQWVLNYQELTDPTTSIAYPSTFTALIYPAGTFVKGTASVINLDAVYDSEGLTTNTYIGSFVEEGVLVARMGHGGVKVTLPAVINGMVGAAALTKAFGQAQNDSDLYPPAAYVQPAA